MNGKRLQDVDSFIGLSSTLNQTGGSHKDIEARIQKAWVAFGKLRVIWNL